MTYQFLMIFLGKTKKIFKLYKAFKNHLFHHCFLSLYKGKT